MRSLAIVSAFALVIGGVLLGSTVTDTRSVAASTNGMPVSHTGVDPNWTVIPGWQAVWPQPLDEESLYWVVNRSGTTNPPPALTTTTGPSGAQTVLWAAYDWAGDMSTYHTRAALTVQKTASNDDGGIELTGSQFSTAAMSRIGGTRADPAAPLTVYFWDYLAVPTLGGLTCDANNTPIVRTTSPLDDESGSTGDLEWSCLPTPYGGTYSAGGEADQYTGNIYMIPGGGSIDNQSVTSTDPSTETGWVFVVWDPVTGAYSQSNSVQPGDWEPDMTTVPQERVKVWTDVNGTTAHAPGAAYDISLDSDGNAYAYSGVDPGTGDEGNMSIVRMEPARDSDGNIVDGTQSNPWRYYVVTKIRRDDPTQSWSAPSSIYGNGILNGQLILGANTRVAIASGGVTLPTTATIGGRGTTTTVKIDPQSATAKVVWSVGNQDSLPTLAGYDNASSQGAEVIRGALYQDVNSDGEITADEPGLPNETVALYNSSGTLLSVQQTDSLGQYSFLIAAVTGMDTVFYVRPVEVTALLPDGVTRVNGALSWGQGSLQEGMSVNKVPLINTTEIQCMSGNIAATPGPCDGARPATSADPPLGALGSVSSPSAWLAYAKVTFNTGQHVPTADFGYTARGSFGDAPAGPLSQDVPMHANVPSTVWLGATLGSYAGPASVTTAHPSDDGVYLDSYVGKLPLEGTILANGYVYHLSADVSGPRADNANVTGWTTVADTNTWRTSPAWTPTIASGKATGDFQMHTTGAVQLRVNASEKQILLPTNADKEYYGVDTWTTGGEIEDYGLSVADAVIRPALVTTRGEVSATAVGQEMIATPTLTVGSPIETQAGEEIHLQVSVGDPRWMVSDIAVRDVVSGDVIAHPQFTEGDSVSFPYTPQESSDVVVEATLAPMIDLEASTLTLDRDSAPAGEDITATATIIDSMGDPVPGVTVSFDNASTETTLTGEGGTKTCVTREDGTCTVTITSTTLGEYPDEISATVDDQPFTGSPQSVAFTHGDQISMTFEVSPSADPADEIQTNWREADGVDSYEGVLTAQDQYGNQVADLDEDEIIFAASSTDVRISDLVKGEDGTYSVRYTSTVGSPTPQAWVTYEGVRVGQAQPIPFIARQADLMESSWVIGPTGPLTVGNGDANTYTATATILDRDGNPLENIEVSFTIAGSGPVFTDGSSCLTRADGTCEVAVFSTTAGTYSVTATVPGGAITNATTSDPAQPVAWNPDQPCVASAGCAPDSSVPPAHRTRTEVTRDNQTADGESEDIVTVYVYDRWGNPVPDVDVDDPSSDTEHATTDEDGTARIIYTSTRAGSHRTGVSVDGGSGEDVDLTFVPGPVCVIQAQCVPKGPGADPGKQTRIEIITNDALVNDDDSVAVYAYDEYGNPVEGQVFTVVTEDPDLRLVGTEQSTMTVVSDPDGTVTWKVTSPVAGTHHVRVLVDGVDITGSPLDLRFVGPPQITSPSDGDVLDTNEVTITGVGRTDGDTITVSEDDQEICTATVIDGEWSCTATMTDGEHTVIAIEETSEGTQSDPSDAVSFTIDTAGSTPSESSTGATSSSTESSDSPTNPTGPTDATTGPTPSQTPAGRVPTSQAPAMPPGGEPGTMIPTGGTAHESIDLFGVVTGLVVASIGLWVGVKFSRRQERGGR